MTKKTILTAIAALIATALTLRGETYSINVGEFTRLKVVEAINVDYRCNPDSAGMVIFRTDLPDAASAIGMSNNKGELTISFTVPLNEMKPVPLPTVTVYSSFLTKVENSGDSLVRVLSVQPCPEFAASQIGNGRIVVRDIKATQVKARINTGNGQVILFGKCEEASLKMTGAGTLQADGLEAQTVNVGAYGTGSIGCCPEKLLKIHGLGSTKIFYKGSPEIRNRAVGVKVEQLP